MSIKVKLVLSYIAMLVVPFFLTAIAAVIILAILFSGNIREFKFGRDFAKNIVQKTTSVYTEIDHAISNNPDKMLDKMYLSQLDSDLAIANTGIILEKSGSNYYISDYLKNLGIADKLTRIAYNNTERQNIMTIDNKVFSISQRKFTLKDGTEASIFYLIDVGPIGRFAGKFMFTLSIAVLIILVLTNGLLTFIVSRSILRPLAALKKATMEIKDGNLDFELQNRSKDEIGVLCNSFEDMRCKLKESVALKLQYEENRKELISSISHDLKTPITSIKGYVEGIMDGVANSPDKMDRYIKTIYSKANDLDRLIDDLFLFSKLDVKKVPFNFEHIDLKSYFADCLLDLQLDLEKRGIQLSVTNEGCDTVKVLADREKLKRVIVNIVANSVKYMDKETGKIEIKLHCDKNLVTAKIWDNGQGIKEEDLPRVFERFYRAEPSRSIQTGGSGLGLAIAKQIIEGHGGDIWAESVSGGATAIYFTLKRVGVNEEGIDNRG